MGEKKGKNGVEVSRITENAFQYLIIPREETHNVPRREWNVKEEAEFASQIFFDRHLKIRVVIC